jgi:hypothetical protein
MTHRLPPANNSGTPTTTTTTPALVVPNPPSHAAAVTAPLPLVAAPAAVATPATTNDAAAVTTELLPDQVPSSDTDHKMIMVEEVSSSSLEYPTTKNKRHNNDGKNRKSKKPRQQEPIMPSAWPANAYDKLTQKVRHDTLWSEATTKHALAKTLIEKCRNFWLDQHHQQQQHQQGLANDQKDVESGGTADARTSAAAIVAKNDDNDDNGTTTALPTVLSAFVLPSVPGRLALPANDDGTPTTSHHDLSDVIQRVGDYTAALIERNGVLEQYLSYLENFTTRLETALQTWTDTAERRQQRRTACTVAAAHLAQLERDMAMATAAVQQLKAKEVDAVQEDQRALDELVACLTSTVAASSLSSTT